MNNRSVIYDDLPSLAVFARVVEERSFTRAAAELGLGKAAVSQRIARLEGGRLRQVLAQYTTAPFGIYAIFAERGRPTSAARTLVDHIALALRQAAVER